MALIYAPLAYGCTRPQYLPGLYALLGAFIALGILSQLVARELPDIPRTVLVCVAAILIQGWWLTFNPAFVNLIYSHGGVVDTTLDNITTMSRDSMSMTTVLLLAFVVLCQVFRDPNLRRFSLMALSLSCGLVCIIGILLKIYSDQLMPYIWREEERDWNVFAFFRYHANAGAFINLGWPFVLVFARRAYAQQIGLFRRIVWTTLALAAACALFLNASKASLLIGLLILPWPFATSLMRMKRRRLAVVVAVVVVIIGVGVTMASKLVWEGSFQRLTETNDVSLSWHGRLAAYHEYADAVPDVGAFGLGPGLFPLAFPYQTNPLGNVNLYLRDFAHEDFLQGILEWGWFGVIWWSLLVTGGLYRAFRTYFRREWFPSRTDRHLVLGGILAVLGTLTQALVDFPLQVPSIRLFFYVALALCWVSPSMLRRPPPDPSEQRRHYWIPVPAQYAKYAEQR